MSNIHLLEVVDRNSETQLQVGENFKKIFFWVKALHYVGYTACLV